MVILKADARNACKIFEISRRSERPVIFPTDTIYGIGAPLSSITANRKIYEIKERPDSMTFPILAGSIEQAQKYADFSTLTDETRAFVEQSWKKRITFVFKAMPNIHPLYVKGSTIAIRIPAADWLRDALTAFGEPVTATSVNKNKQPAMGCLPHILKNFGHDVSLYLNGTPPSAVSSEIYDISSNVIIKLRGKL